MITVTTCIPYFNGSNTKSEIFLILSIYYRMHLLLIAESIFIANKTHTTPTPFCVP